MPDYRKMYSRLMMATEQALDLLNDALRECELLYIGAQEPELQVIPMRTKEQENGEKE